MRPTRACWHISTRSKSRQSLQPFPFPPHLPGVLAVHVPLPFMWHRWTIKIQIAQDKRSLSTALYITPMELGYTELCRQFIPQEWVGCRAPCLHNSYRWKKSCCLLQYPGAVLMVWSTQQKSGSFVSISFLHLQQSKTSFTVGLGDLKGLYQPQWFQQRSFRFIHWNCSRRKLARKETTGSDSTRGGPSCLQKVTDGCWDDSE